MILFDNVSKRYPSGKEALSDVSLRIKTGEMAFLTGNSGAGKSTLLKLVMVLERATKGQVIIQDVNLSRIATKNIPALRRNIGVVFQNHQLLFDRNVFENVALPLYIAGFQHREIGRRVRAALSKVGLNRREKAYPISLSGGEQQRVGIARAVVNRPPLLLADEPTGNLDPALSEEVMNLFLQFNQVGVTVLIASHNLELISRLKKRQIRLHEGRLL